MAEGELDVDSLISRLLEGEFVTMLCLYHPAVSRLAFEGYQAPTMSRVEPKMARGAG